MRHLTRKFIPILAVACISIQGVCQALPMKRTRSPHSGRMIWKRGPVVNTPLISQNADQTENEKPKLPPEDYIIKDPEAAPPKERFKAFTRLEQITDNAQIFLDLYKKTKPECLFSANGAYTIFIPYNAAVNQQILDTLSKLTPEALCLFLSHYIVPKEVSLTQNMPEETYVTIAGSEVLVRQDQKEKTTYYAGDATIVMPYALSFDGITIHIIDTVPYIYIISQELQAGEELEKADQ